MANINLIVIEVTEQVVRFKVKNSGLFQSWSDEESIVPPCYENWIHHSIQNIPQAHFISTKNNHLIVVLNSYLLDKFIDELKNSQIYRNAFMSNVWNHYRGANTVVVCEMLPEKPYIDHSWGNKLEYLAKEREELENTMSWLSTLGGAFSALGEEFSKCAKIAGRISVAQFRLASRLGDPGTQSRCRLYLSLSLLQQGRLKIAKKIIKHEHSLALATPVDTRDIRLVRMCHGIWAKLKYLHELKHSKV